MFKWGRAANLTDLILGALLTRAVVVLDLSCTIESLVNFKTAVAKNK